MADTLNLLSLKSRHRVMETPACTIAGLGVKPNTPTAFRLINTPIIATRTSRRSGGDECQCSVSHAAATSFPASSVAP
jgi:hypothetical protein